MTFVIILSFRDTPYVSGRSGPVSEGSVRRETPAGLPEFCITDTHVPLVIFSPDLASRPRIHALNMFPNVLFGLIKVLCISFCH